MSVPPYPFSTRAYPIERHALLRRSFVHLKGVGPRSEAHLWRQGITDWQQLLDAAPKLYKGKRLDHVLAALDASLEAWQRRDLYYFHTAFPGNERWRLIEGAFDEIAYFDIEATGMNTPPLSQSTAIAFYFRGQLYQEHDHFRKRDLIEFILAEAPVLCTYNGGGYDIPFLRAEYDLPFHNAHVDLCPWLRRQGFKGGLKAVQKMNTHLHQRSSLDITGYDAVRLWRLHEQGVPNALETLLTYNAEDVLILEPLLVEAYNRELAQRPDMTFAPLVSGPVCRLQTDVCPRVYALLRAQTSFASPEGYDIDNQVSS